MHRLRQEKKRLKRLEMLAQKKSKRKAGRTGAVGKKSGQKSDRTTIKKTKKKTTNPTHKSEHAEPLPPTTSTTTTPIHTPTPAPTSHATSSRASRTAAPSHDRVFNEFRQLLYATDGVRPLTKVFTEYKEQFRGGNPYVTETIKLKKEATTLESSESKIEGIKRRMRVAGRFEYFGQTNDATTVYYCQGRRCAKALQFPTDTKKYLVTCDYCGCLNNRNHFIHVDAVKKKSQRASFLPLVQSHADVSRAKFKLKLRDRFLENMNDVILSLASSARQQRSPSKRVWKEFDRTQQRLAHTWKQPTPSPQDYGIPFEGTYNKRVLSHARSQPSYDFAPSRHQKKTSIDM